MICGMTYYEILWYFLLYSFIGWMVEVAFHAVTLGKVINRGFLNGPLCPVYGFGMLAVLAVCNSIESSGMLAVRSGTTDGLSTFGLFIVGMVLATLVELIAGWLLDIAFHTRWWDYSDKPLNLHGYICLEFSILWGIGITLIVRIIHPIIEASSTGFHHFLPERYGWFVLLLAYIFVVADFILTTMTVIGLNKKLKQIDEMNASMRTFSNSLSETIGTNTIKTAQVIQEGEVQAALARAEFRDAAEKTSERLHSDAAAVKTGIIEEVSAWKTTVQDTASATKSTVQEGMAYSKTTIQESLSQTKNRLKDSSIKGRDSLNAQYEALKNQTDTIKASFKKHTLTSGRRLMRAFPQMKSRNYEQLLEEIKKSLE